jgi:hypothetical protein
MLKFHSITHKNFAIHIYTIYSYATMLHLLRITYPQVFNSLNHHSGNYIYRTFNIKKHRILAIYGIYGLHMRLKTNKDYYPKQHYPGDICNEDSACFLWGMKLISVSLSLFWKNKRRLIRSPCYLCVCVSSPINVTWRLKEWIMEPEEMSLVGNGSVNTFSWQCMHKQ